MFGTDSIPSSCCTDDTTKKNCTCDDSEIIYTVYKTMLGFYDENY